MMSRKRTKKVFLDYNDYTDRPFGLKWGTAFALDELMKVVIRNKTEALLDIKELPLMSMEEVDKVLQEAFMKSKRISIQLNQRDDLGALYPNIEGIFQGFFDDEQMYLEELAIPWSSIRNIRIIK